MKLSRLGPGAEFDLIRRVLEKYAPEGATDRRSSGRRVRGVSGVPGVRGVDGGGVEPQPGGRTCTVGPGDDAAIFSDGLAVSTDLSVEDVHFRRSWLTDREIGFKACATALSDLAAVGAEPRAVLVSAAIPAARVDAEGLMAGIHGAAARAGASVVGGDLSSSPGPLVVDTTVIGQVGRPLLRSAARPGDELWVSGALGGAAAAVRVLSSGGMPAPGLRTAFVDPPDRTGFAMRLAGEFGGRAAIDISDGLLADSAHLAAASGVQVVIVEDAVPIAPLAREELGDRGALEAAFGGGDDYELLFTAPPDAAVPDATTADAVAPNAAGPDTAVPDTTAPGTVAPGLAGASGIDFRTIPVRIGWIARGEGTVLLRDGEAIEYSGERGFDHLGPTGSTTRHLSSTTRRDP